MTREYTHTDAQGTRWRMDEGRPVSDLADRLNDELDAEIQAHVGASYSPTASATPSSSESLSPSVTPSSPESFSLSPTASITSSASCSGSEEIPEDEEVVEINGADFLAQFGSEDQEVPSAATPTPIWRPRATEWAAHHLANQARMDAALSRARGLLVEVIGEAAVQDLENGGHYVIPSKRWPGTEYHIPKTGFIRIVMGGLWQDACLVSSNSRLPWPDVVLSRIKMIEVKETIVQQVSNSQGMSGEAAKLLKSIVNTLTGDAP